MEIVNTGANERAFTRFKSWISLLEGLFVILQQCQGGRIRIGNDKIAINHHQRCARLVH